MRIKKMVIIFLITCVLFTNITVNAITNDNNSNYRTLFSVPIGNGSGFIAYTEKLEDCERFGPESFAVLEDKWFYILDSVENEIEIFNRYGQSIKTIELQSDHGYYDIEVRDNGDIVLLTNNGSILEVYENGDVKNTRKSIFPQKNDKKFNYKFLSLHKNRNGGDIVIRNKIDGSEINIDDNNIANSFDSVAIKQDGKNFVLSDDINYYVKYNYESAGTYPLKYTDSGELMIHERELLKGKKLYIENRISIHKNGKKIGMALAEETINYEMIPHKYLLATEKGKIYQLLCNNDTISLLELKISKEERSNINRKLVEEIVGDNTIESSNITVMSTEQERINAYYAAVEMCEHNWYYDPSTMKTPTTSTTKPPDHLTGNTSMYVDGIPYKWGGFDDIDNFTTKISQGKKAGNIKLYTDSSVTGIDCSGFISRAYGLTTKLGTTTMHTQFSNITWDQIYIGDIANDSGSHVWLYFDHQYDWQDNWVGCWTYESTTSGYEDRTKEFFRTIDECQDYTPMRKK